jgi:hypothetical protein
MQRAVDIKHLQLLLVAVNVSEEKPAVPRAGAKLREHPRVIRPIALTAHVRNPNWCV